MRQHIDAAAGTLKCDLAAMKQLWLTGVERCRCSGVLTFDPSIDDPEFQEKVVEWTKLTEWLHEESKKHASGRKRARQ